MHLIVGKGTGHARKGGYNTVKKRLQGENLHTRRRLMETSGHPYDDDDVIR